MILITAMQWVLSLSSAFLLSRFRLVHNDDNVDENHDNDNDKDDNNDNDNDNNNNNNKWWNLAESEALWGRRGEAKLEGGGQDEGEGGENT